MAGYYHERLAEGTLDPLKAKAIVFRDDNSAGALVVCDLIGIATDLTREEPRPSHGARPPSCSRLRTSDEVLSMHTTECRGP